MQTLLSAASGESPSLADSEDYVELLRLMQEHNAVSVFMSSKTVSRAEDSEAFLAAVVPFLANYLPIHGYSQEEVADIAEPFTSGAFPLPFDTYAVASAWDEAGFHTLVAYIYPNGETALASLPKVAQRFSEARTLIDEIPFYYRFDPSFSVEGRTVLVRLNGNAAEGLIYNNDPIFAHE